MMERKEEKEEDEGKNYKEGQPAGAKTASAATQGNGAGRPAELIAS